MSQSQYLHKRAELVRRADVQGRSAFEKTWIEIAKLDSSFKKQRGSK